MHQTSYETMKKFVATHLSKDGGKVLDVGSRDINGTYRPLFGEDWEYTGLDIVPGPNVDVVEDAPYNWGKIEAESFDAVICGQTLEHAEDDAALVGEMAWALRPGGWLCLIAPSQGGDHGAGEMKDYRRYTAERLAELAENAGLTVVENFIFPRGPWFDAVVMARKNHLGGLVDVREIPVVLKDEGYMIPKKMIEGTDK